MNQKQIYNMEKPIKKLQIITESRNIPNILVSSNSYLINEIIQTLFAMMTIVAIFSSSKRRRKI